MDNQSPESTRRNGFFEDAKGNKSSTRLKTFLASVTAMVIALCSIFIPDLNISHSLPVIIALLAFSSGEKSFQTYLESKSKSSDNE